MLGHIPKLSTPSKAMELPDKLLTLVNMLSTEDCEEQPQDQDLAIDIAETTDTHTQRRLLKPQTHPQKMLRF